MLEPACLQKAPANAFLTLVVKGICLEGIYGGECKWQQNCNIMCQVKARRQAMPEPAFVASCLLLLAQY